MTKDERHDFERELLGVDDWDDDCDDDWGDDAWWRDGAVGWSSRDGRSLAHGPCPLCFREVVYRQHPSRGVAPMPHSRGFGWGLCRGVRIAGLALNGPPLRAPLGAMARRAARRDGEGARVVRSAP